MSRYDFLLNGKNINDKILNFSYSENLDDVASSFSFDALDDYGISQNNKINRIQLLDKTTQKVFYDGWITDWEHTTDVRKYHYLGFDVGFYLNKNKVIKQFTGENIGKSIKDLCKEYEINLTNLPEFKATIKKIYKDIAFADILKELLQFEKDKGGLKDTYIDCKNGNLNIRQYKEEQYLSAIIANNISVSSHDTINNVRVTKSIQDMKNSIYYTDNNEKSVYKVVSENKASISQFGLLRTVEKIDTNKKNNLKKLADEKLAELNKIKETYEGEMLGDYRVQKGKIIKLNIPQYNMTDTYLLRSVKHNIDSHKELISYSLDKYKWN